MKPDERGALADRIEAADGPDRRILNRLDRTGECWLWTGALDERGRGRVWHKGKLKLHHRAIWEILVGPIPKLALLCHHCDNPQCGNPAHLYVGDGESNAGDMVDRGRHFAQRDPVRAAQVGRATGSQNDWARGTNNPKAKLTPQQVDAIRASGLSSRQLGRDYGVNPTTIQRIKRGASWTT